MRISRRGFLAVAGAAPLGGVLLPWSVPTSVHSVTCALDESRAGYDKALAGLDQGSLLVFPAAVGWDPSIARRVRDGATVIFESAAGFGDARSFDVQRDGLRSEFGLTLEVPSDLSTHATRPVYVDLLWPVAARVRDFSSLVVVRGGETVGRLGALPVAAFQRRGAGTFVFLGSPIGPALWTSDPQAHVWLFSLLAVRS